VTEYLYFVFQHKTNLFQEFISTDEYSTSLVLCGLMHGSLLCKEYSLVFYLSQQAFILVGTPCPILSNGKLIACHIVSKYQSSNSALAK